MSQWRFVKAARLARALKTWNHNDVAQVIRDSLDSQDQNARASRTADSGYGTALETKSQPIIDYKFDNPIECFHN